MNNRQLLSRSAESLFWMARYTERAENIARAIEVNLALIPDSRFRLGSHWAPLFQISGDEEEFNLRYDKPSQGNVTRFLTFDETYPNSILSCLYAARENARSVRDVISSEVFEQINRFYLMVRDASQKPTRQMSEFYREVRMVSHMVEGVTHATMSHGEGWQFVRLGRMLERADQTSRILDVKYFVLLPTIEAVGTPIDDVQWTAVLKSCSGFEMYRKEHGRLLPDKIVEFLMLDPEFPRSILYCVNMASQSLQQITRLARGGAKRASERKLGRLQAELAYADSTQVILEGLHEYLDAIQYKIADVGNAVRLDFFAPAKLPVAMSQVQK